MEASQLAAQYSTAGVDLFYKGKYQEAIENYAKSIDLDPNGSLCYCNWGLVLHHLERHDEAIEKYTLSAETGPCDLGYCCWGIMLQYHRKYEEALDKYKKAIEANPACTLAYLNWGLLLDIQGEDDSKVMEKFKEGLVKLTPNAFPPKDQLERYQVNEIKFNEKRLQNTKDEQEKVYIQKTIDGMKRVLSLLTNEIED